MPVIFIAPNVELVEAATDWVWVRTEHGHNEGDTAPSQLRKRIFRSWVEAGWVREADGQIEMNLEV